MAINVWNAVTHCWILFNLRGALAGSNVICGLLPLPVAESPTVKRSCWTAVWSSAPRCTNSLAQIFDFILSLTALPSGMATLEKSGVVGILCTLGDTILPPEVPAIACVACTTEFWTIEAVGGTWADTTVDVDAALGWRCYWRWWS